MKKNVSLKDIANQVGLPLPGVGQLGHRGIDRRLSRFALLHELKFIVLELGLPPSQRGDLVLQGLQLAGRAPTRGQPALILGRPGAHLLGIPFQPGNVSRAQLR